MHTSKAILITLILVLIATAASLSMGVHVRDAGIAALIAIGATVTAMLPLQLRIDRSAVATFQAAWIGSIVHLALFLIAGGAFIFALKPPTSFVIDLLAMYWLTLAGLCTGLVGVMRTAGAQMGGTNALNTELKGK